MQSSFWLKLTVYFTVRRRTIKPSLEKYCEFALQEKSEERKQRLF